MKGIRKHNRDVILRMGDFHIPYQDDSAVEVALKFAEFLQPKILVLDEMIDFYSVSKYNKDPDRKLDMQSDIDDTVELLTRIRKAVPRTEIVMVKSNHDERLRKYLYSKAEELSKLKCLQFENLLELDRFGISYEPDYLYRKVLFKHGNVVRKDSSYTAKAEFYKEGTSGVSGHTHRLGVYYKSLRGGKYVWLEGGCLCDCEDVEYVEGTANWQQGVAVVAFKKNSSHFYPTVVPIINYTILWGKRTFTL